MAKKAKIQLGNRVKDVITTFEGVVVGITKYLTGCTQVLVIPEGLDKDGKRKEGEWFDMQRLRRVGNTTIELDNDETPGCDISAPKC